MSLYESQWVNRLRRERRSEDAETRLAPWIRLVKRRGWDLNPRATFRPPAVFKTAPFDRSGTPPNPIVAEADFARCRGRAGRVAGARRRIEDNARPAGTGVCLAGARRSRAARGRGNAPASGGARGAERPRRGAVGGARRALY